MQNHSEPNAYHTEQACNLDEFSLFCARTTQKKHYPLATDITNNILIYNGSDIINDLSDTRAYQEEFARALLNGPGVIAIKNFFQDANAIDRMSAVFEQILEVESGFGAGDHFGAVSSRFSKNAQANGRIWNVFQKSADSDPETFIDYYKNPLLSCVSEAWLGPHFQVTAQVNIVRPGGKAQISHRDYHLGFQQPEETLRYPLHSQQMSAMLTLQGAVAHSDMPLESGPTKLLPYSQLYPLGYVAYHQKDFQDYFEAHCVQVPLEKGDAVFFNPALFHAAGANLTSNLHRCANLLQISSVFAKPMETVDLAHISRTIYPSLSALWDSEHLSREEKRTITTIAADGYSFPTNLDIDPPIGGLAPETMEALLVRALDERLEPASFERALAKLLEKQRA
ncbi:phytanoyl-CoA dioxygenase family protein [Enterovibrio nigricans]|uniref:Ectoine hydroxylase-related dioxygenase, phytanoyl-CoA dioxygenase (PhyH) family n=1 Tax=Enterovibrio nigricans DSM 22720 TaxID=1121868 RepID=A0A1T4UUL7_9GAMM|nr:phytanoyl-CoA dioxygenase family protein [Enterovibrio nigricans]PKF50005.1 phytanoyl-CoA dioxygenase [Enterovibrio nigricans]SKA56370.1 Ectoine hydroxylase-related dioxygenase, phytanoyl-CoA dioxygenase (PhyH) family [Enterovibrio nigricans DSM 22720]